MDITKLQKLEVSEAHSAPKNGEPGCCVATQTHYSSVLPTYK